MVDATYNLNGGLKPALKRTADRDGPDFFPTPAWATHALIENEEFQGVIWEPACGDGAMAEVLKSTGNKVFASDAYDRGYGKVHDFLISGSRADNIVTNPPYNSAEGFVKQGCRLARKKFALLLRLAFLEGANRARTIFSVNPPARVWVFSERITFYPKGAIQKGSGTTAYAWFVWDQRYSVDMLSTEVRWLKQS